MVEITTSKHILRSNSYPQESFQIAQDLLFVQFAQLVHQLLTSPALTAVLCVDPAAIAAMMVRILLISLFTSYII